MGAGAVRASVRACSKVKDKKNKPNKTKQNKTKASKQTTQTTQNSSRVLVNKKKDYRYGKGKGERMLDGKRYTKKMNQTKQNKTKQNKTKTETTKGK